jgi:phospho-N-acetylmuramoyl-pentapeptide-transferase
MFYWLFYEKLFHLYSPFLVFQYPTFRIAMASLTALLLSMLLGRG